jgi:expansin
MRWALLLVVACSSASELPDDDTPACSPEPEPAAGSGTYYDADGTGNCSFDIAPDRMVAAINATDYTGAAFCGACLAVVGPDGEVIVRVVDSCPGCAKGDLDLSREAFELLAPLAAGRIAIAWRVVECPVTGPIAYRFKDGSNAFWTAIQVREHRYPIASLEARDAGGAFHAIARADYNYFVADKGLGPGPYTLRVTDTRGHVLDDGGIALGDAVVRPGHAQLPACP